MRLGDLLDAREVSLPLGSEGLSITGLTADSREVGPGVLFAALPGTRVDGRRFIPDAVAAGAAAILTIADDDVPACGVPVVRAADPRRVLALAAARFYARQPDVTVAVTGTSGKTSVAEFTRQIFQALGHQAASVGTIGVVKPDGGVYGSLTTPDPVTLARLLSELAGEGVSHLSFEASSHGLDQRRLDGVRLKAAAFTNLGRDHLDYHPTVADYLAAKLRLFEVLLPEDGTAVVNVDDAHAREVVDCALRRGCRLIRVGQSEDADIRLVSVVRDGFMQQVTVSYGGETFDARLRLIGDYQASNAALAAGLAIATGEAPQRVFGALETLTGVKGRLEVVGVADGAPVVVDYAHKPDALDAALKALRPFATGRLTVVFGCGGDRDRGKRAIMGQIAVSLADRVIVTDDNPRSEDPAMIRQEILGGASGAAEIGDRAEAIAAAIADAQAGDVVLIAGKGHETGQIVGNQVLPFSDHDAVAAVLARR